MAGKRRKKRQNRIGTIWISVVVAALLVVMSIQLVKLYEKNQVYAAKEESLQSQLGEEKDRSEKIQEYKEYTKSEKFIEDMAKSRLGLVYDNEVIFKKKQ